MSRFTPLSALALVLLLPRTAGAVHAPQRALAPHTHVDSAAASGVLVAAPGKPDLRAEAGVRYGGAPGSLATAWSTFVTDTAGARWTALWDTSTDRPIRIFGGSIPAPGTSKDPAAAEKHARAFLARHADLFLAGLPLSDFDLVANDDDHGLRTVAFQQTTSAGSARVSVTTGRVNLRYKADRLFMIGAEALPVAPLAAPQVEASAAGAAALAHLAADQPAAEVTATALVAVPLVRRRGHHIALAWRVSTASIRPASQTDVLVDARDGSVIATQEGLRFLSGSLAYDVPVRGPQEHALFPASRAQIDFDGVQISADPTGEFSFEEGFTSASAFARSSLIHVTNVSGEDAALPIVPTDGAEVVWSQKDNQLVDAQLSAFIHGSIAKDAARGLDPTLSFLNGNLELKVNGTDPDYACNAFFNGINLNFFQASGPCSNTARLADVVYHEFGHAFHFHTILSSVGMYDSALGEGAADYFASIITNDPYLSPGFFDNGGYLREFDTDRRWPEDIHWDPHETGLIFAGAAWDLRTILTEELGPEDGPALAHQLFRGALRRAPNIPATFAEVLATDDDDGDLGNGTPHVCQILKAYAPHGLTPYLTSSGLAMSHEPLHVVPSQEEPYEVRVKLAHAFPQCAVAEDIDGMKLEWRTQKTSGTVEMTKDGDDYVAALPGQVSGTQIRYRLRAAAEGHTTTLPMNAADPEYKVFAGTTTPLWCTDFEAGAADWVFGEEDGKTTDFLWGQPKGAGGDPVTAYSGEHVIGTALNTQGRYRKNRTSFATGPVVPLGENKHVRLQLMRWLTVEDGYFDQAEVVVNGQVIWTNQGTDDYDGTLTHADLEWRFEDLDLTAVMNQSPTQLQVGFRLRSDDGNEYGGWNIDDVCLVAYEPPPPPDTGAGGAGGEGGSGAGGEGGSGGAGVDDTDIAGGCSCRTTGPAPAGAPWALLGAAAAIGLVRRGRRSRRAPSSLRSA